MASTAATVVSTIGCGGCCTAAARPSRRVVVGGDARSCVDQHGVGVNGECTVGHDLSAGAAAAGEFQGVVVVGSTPGDQSVDDG